MSEQNGGPHTFELAANGCPLLLGPKLQSPLHHPGSVVLQAQLLGGGGGEEHYHTC